MKKIGILVLFLSLIFTNQGNAQDFSFGVKAGLNISTLGGSAERSYGSKPGFHAGVAAEIPLSDKFFVQPEALVSFQGSGLGLGNDINLFYLSVPVAVKYNVWDRLHIEAGPHLGLLLGSNLDDDGLDSNSIDIGLLAGAGYRLNDNFYFQLRYNVGLINAIEDVRSKNRVLQLSAIYFF